MTNSSLEEGVKRLFRKNLSVFPDQDVVIIVDERTQKIGHLLAQGAYYLDICPTLIIVPQAQQARHKHTDDLPLPLARAIDAANALVSAVSDHVEGTAFRLALLEQGRQDNRRVAHMPGVTESMIASLAHTEYALLESICEAVRLPLLLGRQVQVTTFDSNGERHDLYFNLAGWEMPPIVSSGIVRPSSFDNVPSGEVYVPPVRNSAYGSVVINGSVTGYVFENSDEIVIHFRDGAITCMEPENHPVAKFLEQQIMRARQLGDCEPEYLCELGVGANSAVSELTGATLMDEKAYKTCHIAVGANIPFGGDVDASNIHEDLVFCHPTITIDNKPVISNGELAVCQNDWQPNYKKTVAVDSFADTDVYVHLTNIVEYVQNSDSVLEIVYFDGIGNEQRVMVGDLETNRLAYEIAKLLEKSGALMVRDIAKQLQWSTEKTQRVVQILSMTYGLVELDAN